MAAKNYEVHQSAAETAATFATPAAGIPITTGTMLVVATEVTAVSGTTPTMNHWAQGSADNGASWHDVPSDQNLTSNAAGGNQVAGAGNRNINGTTNITTTGKHSATYKHFPYPLWRLSGALGGTTPSFTFRTWAAEK